MVYDGDCNFCRRSVARWKRICRDALDCAPLQDESLYARFPELSREKCERALHLISPDGTVSTGAAAAFRGLYDCGKETWLYRAYDRFPGPAEMAELIYDEIADHRAFISVLDRIYSGPGVAPLTHLWTRFVFLRGLAIIYLIAFASLAGQIKGLCGQDGIAPTRSYLAAIHAQAAAAHLGWQQYYLNPTLAWFNSSDAALGWYCKTGIILSVLLLFGIAPAPVLFLLWCVYLSLVCACGPFLEFQWDLLLLETGFLAIFFAPLQWLERPSKQTEPSIIALWLMRWLIFRLMLESGCVKLLSGDFSWWNLTALRHHYETQPLPTWIGWHAHQFSTPFQSFSTIVLFVIELVGPALILCGRKSRALAAGAFVFLQVLILLTGNYTFFNYLTILLCVLLLDDDLLLFRRRPVEMPPSPPEVRNTRWPRWIQLPIAVAIALSTSVTLLLTMGVPPRWAPTILAFEWMKPLRSFNNYGLFAVMTRERPEIIVEGSRDGNTWLPYEFKYKPGELDKKPAFVAPFQPRLDWQMWFAALSDVRENPWFLNFETRLLFDTPAVTGLLAHNPFPDKPPKLIRARLFEYHFTTAAERQKTGNWWKRDYLGVYFPPIGVQLKGAAPDKTAFPRDP